MKRLFLPVISLLLSCQHGWTQSKLGEVACVYITTSDLDSSAVFYGKLGFQKQHPTITRLPGPS